jgi:glyoxylase-like metal-dependent hydrolase (beta-lactamase superfamily II)
VAVFGLLIVASIGVYALSWVRTLDVESVTDDVYMISGLGGNVGVLKTSAGAVVVDSMTFVSQGENIRARAEELGGGPVQALINTHYHSDHTHGNPGFPAGTRVISTQRSLDHLNALDADYWQGEAAALLPGETFDSAHEISVGGKTIRLHYLGRGHTDGDLVVLFVEDRVLHAGDLLFHNYYPNIDLEAGGSLAHWSRTLDQLLELDFDRVIAGHGPVTDKQGVRDFQLFVDQLWFVGQKAAREGWTLEETQATDELSLGAGYGVIGIPLLFALDRPFVLRRAFEEANGSVKPYDAP